MKAPTSVSDVASVAIGYVRVSSTEQAQEGVSLEVQKEKLRAYCKSHRIRLIDIKVDEGISGGTIERPGLQAALWALERGHANTLVVTKLDRLTRSVKDLCSLVDRFFSHEQFHLLSLCGMINTHNAAGRMMMLNLANYAQFERELVRERTQEAMNHLKSQGVALGQARFGFQYSKDVDAHGRRLLVACPEERATVRFIVSLFDQGHNLSEIARRLNQQGKRTKQGKTWHSRVVALILEREGCYTPSVRPRAEKVCDSNVSAARARELQAQGFSLRDIAERLTKERHIPERSKHWHAATVRSLLRRPVGPDARKSAAEVARLLRDGGASLRKIGRALTEQGYTPPRGGRWHPATVMHLLDPM
jgi:DNA invertase Pin-like site-specific DNA recombinase